ncbi:MAG: T9SS type A sorting domain-containing protein [Candidatus Cloacimonetes bacterium]|nr:T9SS type A sorting domain-containing protein [Candidatus Cloacimonadota bacterium]
MKIQKLVLLLAIVFAASSLMGQYFNVTFKDTVAPYATKAHVLSISDAYLAGTPAIADRWVVQWYGTGEDDLIDPIGDFGATTGDDFLVNPANGNQNATLALSFLSSGSWAPSGTRIYLNTTGMIFPTDKVYLRMYNSNNIATATKYTQFLMPYTLPSSVSPVEVIANGLGWTAWADVPGHVVADTYNYNLNVDVNIPAEAPVAVYTVNGETVPHMFTDLDGTEENALLVPYTISAAPAGFHWATDTITPLADDFVVGGKAVILKTHTITFQLIADAPIIDYPAGVDTPVVPGVSILVELAPGIDGANLVDAPVNPFPVHPGNAPLYSATLELVGTGPWTIVYTTAAPVGIWYSYVTNSWTTVYRDNVAGTITFVIPELGKGIDEVPIALGDETLPVEFSSFTAVTTAQNFVKLTWVTETETNVSGYNVYRSTDASQVSAVQINPALIDATNTSQTATYTHVDNDVSAQTTYSYWLEIVEMDGTTAFHGPTTVYVEPAAVVVPSLVTTMDNAYPNPFKTNSSTSIAYQVKAGEAGTITIYNIIGQVVKTVPVTETTSPKTFTWNGRDSKGNACGSGIYFYKLSTPSRNVTKKMVIVN